MRKRILLLTQWFEPEPTFKGLSFAKGLVKLGFEVEVVTGFPNYPGGKLYSGYDIKWIQREIIDGVQVTRVPLYPSHNRSAIKRALNYASFAAASLFYGLFFAKRADVIYAYHPPLTVGMTACLIRIFRRIPVVYDIQDLWPDTLRATGMLNNEKILKVIDVVCSWVYKTVDHIVVLSPGFKKILIQRGVPDTKLDVIYNWADEEKLSLSSTSSNHDMPADFPGPDTFKVLFAGNMGSAQSLDAIVLAAKLLQEKKVNVKFLMLGTGLDVERLKVQVSALLIQNVIFYPPVSMSKVSDYLHRADALLVHLRADELFKITIPSKTQAYMAVGKPILMALEGDAAELIVSSGAGILAHPENPESIVYAVEELIKLGPHLRQEMGDKGLAFYKKELSIEVGCARFGKVFEDVIQKNQKSC